MLCIFARTAISLITQADEGDINPYEVLFRGLHVFGIAVVDENSDIIWLVVITIWQNKDEND
jgi:hypothetical protein